MVTLEQIKLLETKVGRAIDVVTRITGENAYLKGKLENYQKRIDELEVLIQRFKEDQGRIEDGILSALDRLNEFEAAMENSIAPVKPAAEKPVAEKPAPARPVPEKATVVPEARGPAPEDGETGDALMFSVPEDEDDAEDDAFGEGGDFDGSGDSGDEDGLSGGNGIPGDNAEIPDNPGGGTAELDIF
ncbi:MAG: cell division protein ZapB [Spirochaetaceae bacterium]|jgi:hypothetical protein|nr:cell division protein ZapB [Spirochaetaceae bacterium]